MSKSVPAETTTLLLGASSIAPRSPERRALKAAVERRDGAAEELAAAVKRHGDVSLRLDRERAEARRLAGKDVKDENDDDYVTPEDAEAWGITGKDFEQATTRRERKKEPVDYSDIDALVRGAAEATQKLAVTQASISVLTKALKARAIDVTQAEQRLGHAEVTRRRWGLKFLLGNAVKLNGSGGTDEAKRARALLCDGLLPAPDTPSDFDDGTEDEWKLTFEMLQRDADALLPD
jgi:hypothetical protein